MFEQQRKFEGCKDKNYLPFDFYLPTYNTIIEFDGRQHFGEVNYFKSPYELTKLHDEIKNEFCHNNHINLLFSLMI